MGLVLFSSPFDPTAVDFLQRMEVELYKVASFEIGDIPLLKSIGKTQRPTIVSRGLATRDDIELAIKTLEEAGCPTVAVLHCVSAYPSRPEEMNLATIADISSRFDVVAGLSDHTLGIAVALTSVGLGASIIEKHFTLSRSDEGPDSAFSLEPPELRELVESVRIAEKAVGAATYESVSAEEVNRQFKKSIFVVADIMMGELFSEHNIRVIRPGHGLPPIRYFDVLGKRASRDIERAEPLTEDMIQE